MGDPCLVEQTEFRGIIYIALPIAKTSVKMSNGTKEGFQTRGAQKGDPEKRKESTKMKGRANRLGFGDTCSYGTASSKPFNLSVRWPQLTSAFATRPWLSKPFWDPILVGR